jgi:DNA repair protein RecN (Recombination protein N)
MLRFLSIRHLAVIDRLEIDFEPGLNILTGETGAGKSILVEAIDLLVGGRASADLVRTGEDAAAIQAVFERPDGREVIVRRELSSQGRSRAFIDDALATSGALRELGDRLLDLHGQHEHQALLDPAEHLDVLDAYANLAAGRAELASQFDAWRAAAGALERTRLDDREKRARIEMASFQLQEIDRANPAAGEDETLAAERLLLANADRLSRLSADAFAALYDGDAAALASLGVVWKRLGELSALDARFAPYLDQREDIKARLDDLAHFLRSYAAGLDQSPDRLQTVEDRLAAIERLKKKYGPSLADVLMRRDARRDELAALESTAERAAALELAERTAREAFAASAARVSDLRRGAAPRLARALESALTELAMPKSRVDVRVTSSAEGAHWTSRGLDVVEFYLSPNPGEEVRPLASIASGGELSRIMLALRQLGVADQPGRTLIFDEVDAGIGGEAADAVGRRLQDLGTRYQVLCVTHLPQIAARAGTHFRIAKHVRAGRTGTVLERLDAAGREQEIARMIAGAEITPVVLASARELLRSRESEVKAKGESESDARAKGRKRGA